MLKEPTVMEFYDLKQLFSYPEWQRYVDVVEEHEAHLQKEVNRCVRDNDLNGAIKFLAQKDLIPKLLRKVKDRAKSCEEKE